MSSQYEVVNRLDTLIEDLVALTFDNSKKLNELITSINILKYSNETTINNLKVSNETAINNLKTSNETAVSNLENSNEARFAQLDKDMQAVDETLKTTNSKMDNILNKDSWNVTILNS